MSMGSGGIFGNPGPISQGGDPFSIPVGGMPDVLSQQLPQMAAAKPKLFGKGGDGWKYIGILGDALQTAGGGRGTYMPAMLDVQQQAEQERRFQQQLAQQAQLKREELANRTPYRFSDNAGNVWSIGNDGQPTLAFVDRAPKVSLTGDGRGGVTFTNQPNPYANSVPPKAPVGGLQMIPDPTEPVAGTKQPVAGATAPSQTISQAEFLNARRVMGSQKAIEWLRSHNIAIGN